MYRQCTTEKTAMQQKTFHEALYTAMQDRLYSHITITDLCNQTGLSRNIFYRLFDCKDDVLYALIDHCFYECSKEIHVGDARNNLMSFFTFWKDKKEFLDMLEKNRLESLLSIRGTLCCCRIDFGMQKFIQADWNNYDMEILSFYISGFVGILFHWYHSDFARSVEEMTDITIQILNHPPILLE